MDRRRALDSDSDGDFDPRAGRNDQYVEPATPNLVRMEINSSLPKGLKLNLDRGNVKNEDSASSDGNDFRPKNINIDGQGAMQDNSVSKNLLMKNLAEDSDSDDDFTQRK